MIAQSRVVSLWELMQTFDAGRLNGAIASLASFHAEFKGHEFPPEEASAPFFLTSSQVDGLRASASIVLSNAKKADLSISLDCAERLHTNVYLDEGFRKPQNLDIDVKDGWSQNRFKEAIRLIHNLLLFMPRELSTKLVFTVPPVRASFLLNNSLFGARVSEQFPSLQYDVEESAKCLGLERSTAAAFHAIRLLEGGIRALARCLDIPDPTKAHERSWKKSLDAIKARIDAHWPTSSDRLIGDGRLFDETHAALVAMQNPYRNATMHLDSKYTYEEAYQITMLVRGLVSKIAERMDENGQPTVCHLLELNF